MQLSEEREYGRKDGLAGSYIEGTTLWQRLCMCDCGFLPALLLFLSCCSLLLGQELWEWEQKELLSANYLSPAP